MKNRIRISLLAGVLAALMMLSSCAERFVYDKELNGYVRNDDGTVFYAASANYRAVEVDKEEKIGEIKRDGLDNVALYPISGADGKSAMDADVWLADDKYNVYVAEGETLPKLWEMEADEIRIFQNNTVAFSLGTIDSVNVVEKVVDAYRNGMSVSYADSRCDFRIVNVKRDDLAFCSQNYKGLYYVLLFYRFEQDILLTDEVEDPLNFTPAYDRSYTLEEYQGVTYVRYNLGTNFLYDRATGLCYPVDGLMDSYFNN